ncbi:unnamed protein product [Phytomonas sp. EM1]|nr:unnamed protein product [Phytomonas sp. EM1]|eukprot:CCW59607.1 unnamed protein product [Phytomonas sp. isolate EM1]
MHQRVFCGTIFEAPEPNRLSVLKNALILVNSDGVIEKVLSRTEHPDEYDRLLSVAKAEHSLTELSCGQYFMPGFVDLHVHAPQWPQLGKAMDCPLELWLHKYTFPLEAKYSDIEFAAKAYNSLVEALLANGTTCVAYFATAHVESSLLLAKICLEKGQRAVVGRVALDLPSECPEYYRDPSPQESVALSERFIREMQTLPGNELKLVLPAVIPRFIPTSSHEALIGLGKLVQRYGCHVQTHCSESDWEHHHVIARYNKHDAFALDDFGLLTRQTVLAHSVFLSDEDMDLVKHRGSAVAHCPLSNIYFSNAVFPLAAALRKGLHVGLGTDISGGHSASIFDAMRFSMSSSRLLASGINPNLPREERSTYDPSTTSIDHLTAFYAATTMGGISLDLKVGRLMPGYFFDAVVVDTTLKHGGIHIFKELDNDEDIFQKIILTASPSNIVRTYVSGRTVYKA